jgi:hypothetical protein
MPGIPVGPGTVFYLLAALAMPLVNATRRLGRSGNRGSPPPATRQVAVALGMLLTGLITLVVFNRISEKLGGNRGSGMVVLSSPLLIAGVILLLMATISRLARIRRRALTSRIPALRRSDQRRSSPRATTSRTH